MEYNKGMILKLAFVVLGVVVGTSAFLFAPAAADAQTQSTCAEIKTIDASIWDCTRGAVGNACDGTLDAFCFDSDESSGGAPHPESPLDYCQRIGSNFFCGKGFIVGGNDFIPPTFLVVDHNPSAPAASQSVTVRSIANDPSGLSSHTLFIDTDYQAGSFNAGVVEFCGTNIECSKTISVLPAGRRVGYYAVATDGSANQNSGDSRPIKTFIVGAGQGIPPTAVIVPPGITVVDTDASGDEEVVFDASGSSDPDGTIEEYRWESPKGTVVGANSLQTIRLPVGANTVWLFVTDNDGLESSDNMLFTVRSGNLCRNGRIDGSEQCDPGPSSSSSPDLGGNTCKTVPGNFTGGTLGCRQDCAFDTRACTSSAAFGVGSPSPALAIEGEETSFTTSVIMGGSADVVSCSLKIEGFRSMVMGNLTKNTNSFSGTGACKIADGTCVAEASFTFPSGSAGQTHEGAVTCIDSASASRTGMPQTITVRVDTGGPGTPGGPGQPPIPGISIRIENPLKADSFTELINRLIDFVFTIAVIIAPILLVVAGIMFMTAAGNASQIARARNMLLWTVIGFAVILVSKGLVTILKEILNVNTAP